MYNWFWKGIKHDISLCCILFFESAWSELKHIDDYDFPSNNDGVILCPNCVRNTLHSKGPGGES